MCDIDSLDLASCFRKKKKLSSKDLKDLTIYVFGLYNERLWEPRIREGEYSILLGACTYYGMSNMYPIDNVILDVGQPNDLRDIHNVYKSIPNYDKENYIIKTDKGFYVPTESRCIIDCIRYKNYGVYEEQFLVAIEDYFDLDKTLKELYEVADFYKVPREDVDYWIKESKNYVRYSN